MANLGSGRVGGWECVQEECGHKRLREVMDMGDDIILKSDWGCLSHWVAGNCVGCSVADSRDVHDSELVPERFLLEVAESRVWDVIEATVSQYF